MTHTKLLYPPLRYLADWENIPALMTQKEGRKMSERREKKRRYNLRLEYIAKFDRWLDQEPPMILFWRWRKWKKQRPVWNE